MKKVEVLPKGIKNRLKTVKPHRAISEYIWNAFDANATLVDINYATSELGGITELSISDNGNGIPFETLDRKFRPVLSSEKRNDEAEHTLIHGRNGIGRLTFYHFCQSAKWETRYVNADGLMSAYSIIVDGDRLDHYEASQPNSSLGAFAGTIVSFRNVFDISEHLFRCEIVKHLQREFSWFLELRASLGYEIRINGVQLRYDDIVKDTDAVSFIINDYEFNLSFVRWAQKLNGHFSKFYCMAPDGELKFSSPTTFNNKGDEFYHSVFISSTFFDKFSILKDSPQNTLFDQTSNRSDEFKELIANINSFLKGKRSPFLKSHAEELVDGYEKNGIFPSFNPKNRWEAIRAEDLKNTVKQLYEIQPLLFSNLNVTQKKTFVSFIALATDSGEVDDLFEIMKEVVDLSSGERERLAKQLRLTKMSSILRTIELLSDRFRSVQEFKKLVFDPTMYADEVPHLQQMMERNYWLIGEEYSLVTAAEPDFEEALRRYLYVLHGDDTKVSIDDEHKNKEMDLFLIRQNMTNGRVENLVLELKHPFNIRLGKKEFDQVYNYYQVIRKEPRFNGNNMEWRFYLIGNKYDDSGYIESLIGSLKGHGERGLAHIGQYKLYVYLWSEIFTDFELRHNFLNKQLQLEKDRLLVLNGLSANDIVALGRASDSTPELVLPSH